MICNSIKIQVLRTLAVNLKLNTKIGTKTQFSMLTCSRMNVLPLVLLLTLCSFNRAMASVDGPSKFRKLNETSRSESSEASQRLSGRSRHSSVSAGDIGLQPMLFDHVRAQTNIDVMGFEGDQPSHSVGLMDHIRGFKLKCPNQMCLGWTVGICGFLAVLFVMIFLKQYYYF